MKKHNVESFNLDHTKVTAPYVRIASAKQGIKGDTVTKYDIRFTQPNKEFMNTGAIHTLEHLTAEFIRDEMSGVIDFSPMGCRTGFYLTVFGSSTIEEIAQKMMTVLKSVAMWPTDKEIPGVSLSECGNYKDHDLEGAKEWARRWIAGIEKKGPACGV